MVDEKKKKRFNKAAFLRKLLSNNGNLTFKEACEIFEHKNHKITPGQFYAVRNKFAKNSQQNKKSASARVVTAKTNNANPEEVGNGFCSLDSCSSLLPAFNLVQEARDAVFRITGCKDESQKIVAMIATNLRT